MDHETILLGKLVGIPRFAVVCPRNCGVVVPKRLKMMDFEARQLKQSQIFAQTFSDHSLQE